jgi:murein DD-endopeptidase MepM/ murein hydrolase activator NlpD
MMAKGLCGRFERLSLVTAVFGGIFLLSSACATAKTLTQEEVTQSIQPPPVNLKAELSSNEVVAGTLARISLRLPSEYRNQPILGQFEGIELPFFPVPEHGQDVYEALLGVPYDRKPGLGVISIKVGEGSRTVEFQLPFQVKDGNYPSEILRVDGRRVNPTNKKDLARIIREQAEVAEIYKRVTPQKYWPGPFSLPIESKITSPFGTRRVYNGQLKNFHPGLDLKAPLKTPIYTAAPGVVVLSKSLFYTGNTVMIDHGYGVITLYAHMSKLQVKLGQLVKAHDLLGLSGKTGRVNGPHLHWQAVVHRVKVNPLGLTQVVR